MDVRKTILWLHRWLGLLSGIVVFIVSITGCLFVFQKEISESIWKERYFVSPESQILPLSKLLEKAQSALGHAQPINDITLYRQADRSWEFMAYKTNDTALTYYGAIAYFRSVFINPYNGGVTGIRDYKYDFFNVVKYLHWSLLLNTRYGQPVVGYSTLIFVILLITGLVLWFPRRWNRSAKNQAFTVRWKARYKRLNYDLHNVPGFYCLLLSLVLALTGLAFSFQWVSYLLYAVASGTTVYPVQKEMNSSGPDQNTTGDPFDVAYHSAVIELNQAKRISISPAEGKTGTIHFYGYAGKETYYDFDELQYDRYSGNLLSRTNYSQKNRGEKLLIMNYDIHVGAMGGLPGKIIAFIVSLICASLPVTGFLIWWWKRAKRPV